LLFILDTAFTIMINAKIIPNMKEMMMTVARVGIEINIGYSCESASHLKGDLHFC